MITFWWLLFLCGVFLTEGASYGSSWQSRNGYGVGYNANYGNGGYGASVQWNYGNRRCQWVWRNWKWSWSCGQNGQQQNNKAPPNAPPPPEQPNQPPNAPQPPVQPEQPPTAPQPPVQPEQPPTAPQPEQSPPEESAAEQSSPEESAAEQSPPEEPAAPQKYIYDIEVGRPSLMISENPYIDIINTQGYKTCFFAANCNFTWTQEINNDTNIMLSWKFFNNWKTSEEQPVKLCDASYSPPDTLAYNAFKLLATTTTNGVTSCPIPAGTVERRTDFPWHMELKDKIPCGEWILYSLKVTVPASSADGKPVSALFMDFRYDLPVDDEKCISREEAEAA